jgi:tight adherence protein C
MQQLLTQITSNGNTIFLSMVFASVVFLIMAGASLTTTWFGVRKRAVAPQTAGLTLSGTKQNRGSLIRGKQSAGVLEGLMMRDETSKSELRKFLNNAGYYGERTPIVFQMLRILSGLAIGVVTSVVLSRAFENLPFILTSSASVVLAFCGFMLPRSIVSLRRDKLMEEHRQGFPDLLDLLVICVEAGIGIESAVDRVAADMTRSYPSLATNLRFMVMEIRAGQTTKAALSNLADRVGIDEAKSFATLVQQSEELGSSLVQSLRVYSDEMRLKRLSRAEEKAHGLPAKLVLPLGLFIFPVVLGVTLFPISIRLFKVLGI